MRVRARTVAAVVVVAMLGLGAAAQYSDRDLTRAAPTSPNAPAPSSRVDINRASIEELLKVPGLKRPWAERIVRYRPYRAKSELVDRGIVTAEVYEKIRDFVIARRK